MPPTVLQISQEMGTDRKGEAIGNQTWYVSLRPESAAQSYLALSKGIDYGTSYPGDDSLIVDAIEASPDGDGFGTKINVKYSNSGRFVYFKNPRKDLSAYVRYTRTWQVVKRQIPVNVKTRYAAPQLGPSETIDAWVLKWIFGGYEKQEVVEVEVEFDVKTNQFATINKIGDQQNKIHQFTSIGTQYRFEAGPVNHTGPTTFTCKYSWIGDPGTLLTASMTEQETKSGLRILFPPLALGQQNQGWIRKPHHEFLTRPSEDPLQFQHHITDVSAYDFTNLTGWRTLPGIPQNL